MEDEIDLKPYILALWRNWQVIAITVVLFAAVVGAYRFLTSPRYEAQYTLLIPAQISNDQKLALEEITKDLSLEIRVASRLRTENKLPPDYELGKLAEDYVETELQGSLIVIRAGGSTQQEAQQLASTWGNEYLNLVAETFVNDRTTISLTQQQLAEAQARYQAAQAELEAFIAAGETNIASLEVRRLSELIESTRNVAFTRLNEYLARQNETELILRDARVLKDRLSAENDPAVAESTAALLLRIRNLSSRGNQPILQIDSSIVNESRVTIDDMERLIESLEAESKALATEIERLKAETDVNKLQELNDQLRAAQVRLEQLNARQRDLVNERDLTFGKVTQLRQRLEELQSAAPALSLRPLTQVDDVARPVSRLRSSLLYAVVAGLAGFVLAAALIVGREAIKRFRLEPTAQQQPTSSQARG
ncbi:Wzz/FepE/Etk N-terminal domain-containing protein [Chloroflexus sp.]|uniref:Wzz/FepE/Etk N-terminal domain-containing protein n=1 Tax=Chloroflexus sp. TaxID=1904827 RepID=UPI00298EEFEB|nr:Wzz/FepE/Etk N-terminal domain-containing protein [Chloroflexus sp.]MDW8403885.1 Wzz/FepE/Etk N-terminal domain-containing protein [Chloroflexus sp.]